MTAEVPPYTEEFFATHCEGALQSACEAVPHVMRMLRPESVIDVGCGTGAWLSVFADAGVKNCCGVDQNWVQPDRLLIPKAWFVTQDLEKPLELNRRFDLAMSVEVAEHLAPDCADAFVKTLTRLAPVVLFSAAVPGQGGVHHVNEQWPEYWAKLFAVEGYRPVDVLRPLLWNNRRVEWWYQQNLLLYIKADHPIELETTPAPQCSAERTLTRIHAELYAKVTGKYEALHRRNDVSNWPLRKLVGALPGALKRAIWRRT